MARKLRSAVKRKPPAWKRDLKEYDTPAKDRFFNTFDRDSEVKKVSYKRLHSILGPPELQRIDGSPNVINLVLLRVGVKGRGR